MVSDSLLNLYGFHTETLDCISSCCDSRILLGNGCYTDIRWTLSAGGWHWMKRKWIIIIGFVLFLGLNGLLLGIDQQGKVERTAYIKDWTATFTGDIAERIDKQAVLTPVEKNPIYFDDTLGSFQEFTIEEGDMVKQGDALFSYKVADFENTKRKLEAETDETRDEIDAVEQAISAVS